MSDPTASSQEGFSLCRGGPTYRVLLKARVRRHDRHAPWRRTAAFVTLTWVPIAILTAFQDTGPLGPHDVPFFGDLSIYARFVLTLPMLVIAEWAIDPWIARTLAQFVDTGVIRPAVLPDFRAAVGSATRLRDSWLIEGLILALVLAINPVIRQQEFLEHLASWATVGSGTDIRRSLAGMWYCYVSAPLFMWMVALWLWRIGLWTYLLRRIAALDLNLVPAHPDRAGGLGFLAVGQMRFAVVCVTVSIIVASFIGNLEIYEGEAPAGAYWMLVGLLALELVLMFGPLLVFTPTLFKLKEEGELDYGALGMRYARRFDRKWVRQHLERTDDQLLGSGDIQSLADLGNSFGFVEEMRTVPFSRGHVIRAALFCALPLLPLGIAELPLAELMEVVGEMIV
jgi:hypothetical protein